MKKERYEFYKEQLKKYETKEEKLEYIEHLIFLLELIDRWTNEDRESYEALCDLLNEVKNE